jgi:hypothetical protein
VRCNQNSPLKKLGLARIALPATCGVAITVVVSWIVAAQCEIAVNVAPRDLSWIGQPPKGWPGAPSRTAMYLGVTWRFISSSYYDTNVRLIARQEIFDTGWPMLGMRADMRWDDDIKPMQGFYLRIPKWIPTRNKMFRIAPIVPIWPGFMINVIVYCLGLCAIQGGARVVRARLRSRNGRCVNCGYEVSSLSAGDVCPECGRPK